MSRDVVLLSGLFAALCLVVSSCAPKGRGAPREGDVTLTVTNARIWTGDPSRPWAEALAVAGERIVAVGSVPQIVAIAERGLVIDAQAGHRLQQALAEVPAAQRDAFLLHIEAGLSLGEIAALAGVPAETIKSRLRYAYRRLRAALEDLQ